MGGEPALGQTPEDWPEPVEVINEGGSSDIVLICEHAANHIPAEYDRLGLPDSELLRHIAWDIGAADVTRRLSARLDAPAFLGTCSRLLVDLNRPLEADTAFPVRSEATDIPGNIGLPESERTRRAERMFLPFHDRISRFLDRRRAAGIATRIITIHSFTPVFLDVPRPWHAGILFGAAQRFGHRLIDALATEDGLTVGANVPYTISRDSDYAIPLHGDDRGIEAVLVEIRQNLVAEPGGCEAWAARLTDALARVDRHAG